MALHPMSTPRREAPKSIGAPIMATRITHLSQSPPRGDHPADYFDIIRWVRFPSCIFMVPFPAGTWTTLDGAVCDDHIHDRPQQSHPRYAGRAAPGARDRDRGGCTERALQPV